MMSGRANGPLRQANIAALASELNYGHRSPWKKSVRYKIFRASRLRALSEFFTRKPGVALANYRFVTGLQKSHDDYIQKAHDRALQELQRCAELNASYVLILREFDAEAMSVRTKKRIIGPYVKYSSMASLHYPATSPIQSFLDALSSVHPVFSVINHEARPLSDAADSTTFSLVLDASSWITFVTRLADAATMIMVLAGEVGRGLQLELEILDQLAAQDRTIIVATKPMEAPIFPLASPELRLEFEMLRYEKRTLDQASILRRFPRRIEVDELNDLGSYDLGSLANRAPFAGLLPLKELVSPRMIVYDAEREHQLAQVVEDIYKLESGQLDREDMSSLVQLLLTAAAGFNELRRYDQSIMWARKGIDAAHRLAPSEAGIMLLFARDGLVTALANNDNWLEAREELRLQIETIGEEAVTRRAENKTLLVSFVQKARELLARIRQESDLQWKDLDHTLMKLESEVWKY